MTGKISLLGVLLVLVLSITTTTSFVYPPPGMQPVLDKKVPPIISKDKESSSSSSSSSESSQDSEDTSKHSSESIDDKEKMLCNVIVRATHDLHIYQSKTANEITMYLKADCRNVGNEELVEQCHEMVSEHGAEIYKHVVKGTKMSDVCKMIEDGSEVDLEGERPTECSKEGGDKCQCCKTHVEKRKMRFRFIVKLMAKKRMHMCSKSPRPDRCRHWVRRKERHLLRKIDRICPFMVCKHLGYCKAAHDNNGVTEILANGNNNNIVDNSPSLAVELLDQRLEAHMTENVCNKFDHFQTLCIHLAASPDSHRYAAMYMAVLRNDTKWLDNILRKEAGSAQASGNVNLCDACKNVMKSSKDFYMQTLEAIRNALNNICKECRGKEKCEEFFNKLIDTFKTYLQSLISDQVCSAIHLCTSSPSVPVVSNKDDEQCAICVGRIQPRKDAALKAIDRLSTYFTNVSPQWNIPQYPQFVSEVMDEARSFINEFNIQDTCNAMGFCGPNAVHDMDEYEQVFVEDISKKVCSMLGSFNSLCQQIVQGNVNEVQTINLNQLNIDDLFTNCEEESTENKDVATANVECPKDKKCQCCIHRVMQKKECAKKRVAKYIWHMLERCKRCPAREKCEHYWQEKKQCWDDKIDKIRPWKVCTRMGYCTKADTEIANDQPVLMVEKPMSILPKIEDTKLMKQILPK